MPQRPTRPVKPAPYHSAASHADPLPFLLRQMQRGMVIRDRATRHSLRNAQEVAAADRQQQEQPYVGHPVPPGMIERFFVTTDTVPPC